VRVAFFKHGPDDALFLFGQGDQEMEREENLVLLFFGDALGLLECFLSFLSEFIQSKHGTPNKKSGRDFPALQTGQAQCLSIYTL
jgi:hypothetical protein